MGKFTYSILFENNQMVGLFRNLKAARLYAKAFDEYTLIRFKNQKDGTIQIFPKKYTIIKLKRKK